MITPLRFRFFFCCLIGMSLLICTFTSEISAMSTKSPLHEAIKDVGVFLSPNNQCRALIEISNKGGYLILDINSKSSGHHIPPITDLTGMLWTKWNILIYSVGPLYGRPGIYLFSCDTMKVDRIVLPLTFNKAYPDGADYFELQSYSEDAKKIYFYYTSDVDSTDFRRFRTEDFLFVVNLDGSEFKPISKRE